MFRADTQRILANAAQPVAVVLVERAFAAPTAPAPETAKDRRNRLARERRRAKKA